MRTRTSKTKPDDAAQVAAYLESLEHPLKAEIEALREIILGAGGGIRERIKWAALSYHLAGTDLLTFNPRQQERVHLVLHHPSIESIESPLLEGTFKGRRMAYFDSLADIREKAGALQRIVQELLRQVGAS
jgi:hypothetical protein